MPPVSSKKNKTRDSHSRNTTPVSTGSTELSQLSMKSNSPHMSYDDILEQHAGGSSPPGAATLRKIMENLKARSETVKNLSDESDKGLRLMSKRRKELQETIREQELADHQEEEARKEKIKRQKRKEQEEERPLAVGAHALARQDGGEPDGKAERETSESRDA